jgi:Golgi nucleoside diphosphatase
MTKWIGLPDDYSDIFGFVYIIKNNHPDVIKEKGKRYYIGCKQCLMRVKKKPLKGKTRNRIQFKDNGVNAYWGSSKELLADIEKYGIENFSREVIELCDSKFHMKYAELNWQLMTNALLDPLYYNGIINIRLIGPKNFVDKPRSLDTLKL